MHEDGRENVEGFIGGIEEGKVVVSFTGPSGWFWWKGRAGDERYMDVCGRREPPVVER
jgi:hypothetical protein